MTHRVRGILVTSDDKLLLIKRTRRATAPYWVFPGGGLEDADDSYESALTREVHEELAGTPDITGLVFVLDDARGTEFFYLARISTWSFADRTGPEFAEADRGDYELEQVPLTAEALDALDIKPQQAAEFLRQALHQGDSSQALFTLPILPLPDFAAR